MSDPTRLFTRGLRWSYREYGLKGAVVFLAVVAVGYYLVDRKLDEFAAGESSLSGGEPDRSPGGSSGPGQ